MSHVHALRPMAPHDTRPLPHGHRLLETPRGHDAPSPFTPTVQAALPTIGDGLRYRFACWSGVVRGRWSDHRLQPDRAPRHAAEFRLMPWLRLRWQQLFDMPAPCRPDRAAPLLMSQSAGSLLLSRLFADLGVQRRHVSHAWHRCAHPAGTGAYVACSRQHLELGLQRVVRLGPDAVVLIVHTTVRNSGGQVVADIDDGYEVRDLPAADVSCAEIDRACRHEVAHRHQRQPELDPALPGVREARLSIPAGLGRDYGRLSGDVGLRHGGRWAARLAGEAWPSLQPMALRNLVVRQLSAWAAPVQHLDMCFVRPAPLGHALTLRQRAGRFEVVDARERLVACGGSRAPARMLRVASGFDDTRPGAACIPVDVSQ